MADYKSVLEKYDAKGNRRMPTAEEDAIERDTTLEGLLIGPGRAAASVINNAINKKARFRKIDTPEIGSGLPLPGRDPWKNVGGKSAKEILTEQETRNNSGLMEKAITQAAKTSMRRSYGQLAADIANDKMNTEGKTTYKKGGSVSSRADGIAQRGKTKGRIC